MRRLFLLRHAAAPRKQSETDKQRQLSTLGQAEALSVGQYMLKRKYKPSFTFSSDSPRTISTFEILNTVVKLQNVLFTANLYNVSSYQVLESIEHADDNIQEIMILGHNPSITSVLDLINASCSSEMLIKSRNYDITGKLVVIETSAKSWNTISKAKNKITDVYFPSVERLD